MAMLPVLLSSTAPAHLQITISIHVLPVRPAQFLITSLLGTGPATAQIMGQMIRVRKSSPFPAAGAPGVAGAPVA